MEPQERPQPGTKPRTNRVRPRKGDVKGYNKYVLLGVFKDRSWETALVYRQYQVSMVNMCGPSSTILGKIYQQTALSINSTRTSRGTEPTTPTTLQAGTPHSSARERQDRSRVWLCRQRLRERLRPLCIAEVSSPTVEQCRGIQPLCQPLRTKKTHQSAAHEVCAVLP